jgi:tRNA dimethylallyltransferase
MKAKTDPLIAIVGPTASGKSELALQIAEYFGGEIICADSLTVYRRFNIGAAKPIGAERQRVAHHLLDIADPRAGFNTQFFQRAAYAAIQAITERGKLPIIVGGSGLYMDSVLFGYKFLAPPSVTLRNRLERMSLKELLNEAIERGLNVDSVDSQNKRRLIRLIETNGKLSEAKRVVRPDTLIIGVQSSPKELARRVNDRLHQMIDAGLQAEVEDLAKSYDWELEPMKAVGYREWREYLEGTKSYAEVLSTISRDTLLLAKKQRTWFKRNKSIHWFSDRYKFEEIVDLVTTFLNK